LKIKNLISLIPHLLILFFPAFLIIGAAVADIALSLTCAYFLFESFRTKNFDWLKTRWVQVALLIWGYFIFNSFFVPADLFRSTFINSLSWIRFILFATALEHYFLQDPLWRKRLLLSVGAILAFTIFDTLYQFISGHDIFGIPKHSDIRLTGPFGHPRVGMFMTFLLFPTVPALLAILWNKPTKPIKYLLGLSLLPLCFGVIALTGERIQLPLIAIGFALLLFIWKRHYRNLLVTAIMGFLLFGVFFTTIPQFRIRLIENTQRDLSLKSENHYYQIWSRAVGIVSDYPLFGVGIRNFRDSCKKPKYGPTDNLELRCGLHTHNIYLEILVETGMIGLLLFTVILILWMRKTLKYYRLWMNKPHIIGLVITLTLVLFPLFATRSFFNNWWAGFFWFLAGWLLAELRALKKSSKLSD
jgi:O-antigen ligase